MTAQDVLDQFSVQIYSPQLSEIRNSGATVDLTNPLHVAMLLIDLETEVSMSGIVNCIGNTTGKYLAQTVQALRIVRRNVDADVLSSILSTGTAAGMTYEAVQADRTSLAQYSVASFRELHGEKWEQACTAIQDQSDRMDWPGIIAALLVFVEENESTFVNALAAARDAQIATPSATPMR